jgi:hypothetical protein
MFKGLPGRQAEPGGDQQRAELVAVQPGGVGLVVQARPPDMSAGRVIEEFFLHCVLVEPGDGAQPTRHGGLGTASRFQVAGEELDVRTAGLEQAQLVLLAPARELAQVQLVGLADQAAIPARNPANASRSVVVNTGVAGTRAMDGVVVAIRHLRGSG